MAQPARTSSAMMTVDEFLACDVPDGKAELIRGELRVTPPAGAPHGAAAANLVFALHAYVSANGLGRVFPDGFGYELLQLPHTVRVPDGSFVRGDRLPVSGLRPGVLELAPDLALEVISPSETASELEEKLHDYAAAGTPLIWVVDPVRRTVLILAADAPARWLREGDTLDGGWFRGSPSRSPRSSTALRVRIGVPTHRFRACPEQDASGLWVGFPQESHPERGGNGMRG